MRVPLLCGLACLATAQALGAQDAGTLRGVVWDSLRATPLPGAIVQLAPLASGAGLSAIADSAGAFVIPKAARGRYIISFIHPFLDSIGVEVPVREIEIGSRAANVTLSTPTPIRLHTALCGSASNADLSSLVMGSLRVAPGAAPLEGGRVTVSWGEMTIGATGSTSRVVTRDAIARADGLFAVCNVPRATLHVVARSDADSTDWIELPMLATGFAKMDLYVATAASRAQTGAAATRIAGAVKDERGLVVPDARVSSDSLATYSDTAGRWSLTGVRYGTRTIAIRRIGYLPQDVSVAVGVDTALLAIPLTRIAAFLDTFKVIARMDHVIAKREFEERRRTAQGKYLSEEDIARLRPHRLSDTFFRLGLRTKPDTNYQSGQTYFEMRGPFGACRPEVYLNGVFLGDALSTWEIDGYVSSRFIVGMELHGPETVPPQYHRGLRECGSLIIWTREY